MDINKFMEKSLENQTRIIGLLEGILQASSNAAELLGKQPAVVNTAVSNGDKSTSGETVVQSTESQGAQTSGAEAGNSAATVDTDSTSQSGSDTVSESTTETVQSKPSEEPQVTLEKESKSDEKPATADDVRAALRDYAKIEGNDAALELLKSHGAASVSALIDLGQEAVKSVIRQAKGVL